MQEQINKYFEKLCTDKFFIDSDEVTIGKANDVIEKLEGQIKEVNERKEDFDEDEIEFITTEVTELIKEIKKKYENENDVIKIKIHQMSGFYMLKDKEELFEELKEYYEESEEEE